ncbi:MAG: hypothetical protein WCD69_20720, partial [Xanthobacteraceae bacterium]
MISQNPFVDVKVTVAKRKRLRETQAFRPAEWRAVLTASLKFTDQNSPDAAARRWVPWLCAYTGARVGEIAQLRKEDVVKREGLPSILITPEAGAVKGGRMFASERIFAYLPAMVQTNQIYYFFLTDHPLLAKLWGPLVGPLAERECGSAIHGKISFVARIR